MLFFESGGIDAGRFIGVTFQNRVDETLSMVDSRTSRMMDDDIDLSAIFGSLGATKHTNLQEQPSDLAVLFICGLR